MRMQTHIIYGSQGAYIPWRRGKYFLRVSKSLSCPSPSPSPKETSNKLFTYLQICTVLCSFQNKTFLPVAVHQYTEEQRAHRFKASKNSICHNQVGWVHVHSTSLTDASMLTLHTGIYLPFRHIQNPPMLECIILPSLLHQNPYK